MNNIIYKELIDISKPFDLAFNLRDYVLNDLNKNFDKNLFENYWNMSLKMTLSWIKGDIDKTDLLSQEYLDIIEGDNVDIRCKT